MKAIVIKEPGRTIVEEIPEPIRQPGEALLKVRRVGLCGSDLNSYRGRNPMVSYPRIPGHEGAATVVEIDGDHPGLAVGMDVTLSPYTSCGQCASCRCHRNNACQSNQTLGVQRDGALTEFICIPIERLYPAKLNLKELCIVEPLTVGFHAAARGRVAQGETVAVLGCGGVGLGVVSACAFRGATTIAVDVDESKLAIAKQAGATHVVHTRQHIGETLRRLTLGGGLTLLSKPLVYKKLFGSRWKKWLIRVA